VALNQFHVLLHRKTRGAFVAAVFSMQGIGILVGASITLAVMGGFKAAHPRLPFNKDPVGSIGLPQSDFAWRIVLALGAIPAALTFYYRLQLPETARYTSIVQGVSCCKSELVARQTQNGSKNRLQSIVVILF
jgi:PHS family inorganic phosphate transporter-like MFS transporter